MSDWSDLDNRIYKRVALLPIYAFFEPILPNVQILVFSDVEKRLRLIAVSGYVFSFSL